MSRKNFSIVVYRAHLDTAPGARLYEPQQLMISQHRHGIHKRFAWRGCCGAEPRLGIQTRAPTAWRISPRFGGSARMRPRVSGASHFWAWLGITELHWAGPETARNVQCLVL